MRTGTGLRSAGRTRGRRPSAADPSPGAYHVVDVPGVGSLHPPPAIELGRLEVDVHSPHELRGLGEHVVGQHVDRWVVRPELHGGDLELLTDVAVLAPLGERVHEVHAALALEHAAHHVDVLPLGAVTERVRGQPAPYRQRALGVGPAESRCERPELAPVPAVSYTHLTLPT